MIDVKIVLDFKECLSIQYQHTGSWITGLSKVLRALCVDKIMVIMHSVVKGRNFWSLAEMVYIHADSSPVETLCMRVWEEGSAGNLPFVYVCYDIEA